MRNKIFLAGVLFFTFLFTSAQATQRRNAPGASVNLPGSAIATLQKIDPEHIRAHVRFLSEPCTSQHAGIISAERAIEH